VLGVPILRSTATPADIIAAVKQYVAA